MDRAELLQDFKSKVDQFEKFQGFIDKTMAQAAKFASSVVEKVIATNTSKREVVTAEIVPMMSDMDGVISELNETKTGVLERKDATAVSLEELELRLAIEELTQKAFDAESKDLKAKIVEADAEIGELDGELEKFVGELQRWRDMGEAAGVLSEADLASDEPEIITDIESVGEELDMIEVLDDEAMVEDIDIDGFEAEGDDGVRLEEIDPEHAVDDMSALFSDGDDDGLSLELGDIDAVGDGDDESGEAEAGGDDQPRRAVMLYQEGTAEEQIYPFTGDVLTLGRGRDNDIQVKNDSKVSRYHRKLYRRNGNFYIEDNKSANGTLVNGELITERRLFGGEEIIIGETFFRFRIMD